MAIPVLIIGRSGTGKSTSLRNCVDNPDWNLIRVLNKPLPFKGKINGWNTDNYQQVMKCLIASKANNIVIDDAGYLITNMFMNGHSSAGGGNGVFTLYNQIGDHFWNLIQFISERVPGNKIVYVMMHEESNDLGEIKPKTIGKLLDEKVCIEGMFTVVLRCVAEGNNHLFVTQAADGAVSKSPIGMFADLTIDNDILLVEKAIREIITLPRLLRLIFRKKTMKAWIRMKHTVFGKRSRRKRMNHDQKIAKLEKQIALLEAVQSRCKDDRIWHIYMKVSDDLNRELDEMTRGK